MNVGALDARTMKTVLTAQRNEITEHHIYRRLSRVTKDTHNRHILERISADELRHHNFWKTHTNRDVSPDVFRIWKYVLVSRIFGITFGIKLMEKGEEKAQVTYDAISKSIPEAKEIVSDEDEHEKELVNLIDEERLKYIGSIVRGLNDALVELTGALAGLTFAFRDTRLVAAAGLITGIAASMSMAGSEYLSIKSEGSARNPLKASAYNGLAYILAVLFLVVPYLVFQGLYLCLGIAVLNAIILILIFSFYISVAKDISFKKRFLEMAGISLGIAALSFLIGIVVRNWLNVKV